MKNSVLILSFLDFSCGFLFSFHIIRGDLPTICLGVWQSHFILPSAPSRIEQGPWAIENRPLLSTRCDRCRENACQVCKGTIPRTLVDDEKMPVNHQTLCIESGD